MAVNKKLYTYFLHQMLTKLCRFSTINTLSLSLITSIESISAPSSFDNDALVASNPNFRPARIVEIKLKNTFQHSNFLKLLLTAEKNAHILIIIPATVLSSATELGNLINLPGSAERLVVLQFSGFPLYMMILQEHCDSDVSPLYLSSFPPDETTALFDVLGVTTRCPTSNS